MTETLQNLQADQAVEVDQVVGVVGTVGPPRWGTPPGEPPAGRGSDGPLPVPPGQDGPGEARTGAELDERGGITVGSFEGGARDVPPVDGVEVLVRETPSVVAGLAGITTREEQLPAALRSRAAFGHAARNVGRGARNLAVIGLKGAPRAGGLGAWWFVRGIAAGCWRIGRWLAVYELHPDLSPTPATSDRVAVAMDVRRERRQGFRRWVLLVSMGLLAAVVLTLWVLAAWLLVPLTALAVAGLVRLGRPEGKKMFVPTGTAHTVPRLTVQGIVDAFDALGISAISSSVKAGTTGAWWMSTPHATAHGYTAQLRLPGGVEARTIVQHEQRLAAALGRPEDCVIVTPMPHVTPSVLRLDIFDKPRLEKVGPGPLARAKSTSWFDTVTVGTDRAGRPYRGILSDGAWFVGGRPGAGKSSTGLVIAAHTALDPAAKLRIINLKGSPDFMAFEPVCDIYLCGSPETDRNILTQTTGVLRAALDDIGRRNDFLVQLKKRKETDGNAVTPELAAKYPDRLGPVTLIIDEVHRLFGDDNPDAETATELLASVMKAGRTAGYCLAGLTQLAGTDSVPAVLPRAARVRGAMRVGDEVSFRQVAGNAGKGAYSALGVGRLGKGQMVVQAEDGDMVKIGVHYLTPAHLDAIGQRALTLRKASSALTGHAAGQDLDLPTVSDPTLLLSDVLELVPATAPTGGAGDQYVAWISDLEAVLDGREEYTGRAAGWLARDLRDRAVPVAPINRKGEYVKADGSTATQRTAPAVRANDVRARLIELLDT